MRRKWSGRAAQYAALSRYAIAAILSLAAASAFAQVSIGEQQDAQVIESLRAAGSNMSKPHDIEFFLVFGDRSQASDAAAEMELLGYQIFAIDASPDRMQWQVHATRQMVPALEPMRATTRALEALAQKHGGDYDGWGTALVQ